MSWLKKFLSIRTDEEITKDVENEPTIRSARRQLARVESILKEIQDIEDGPPRARKARKAGVRS